MRGIVPRIRNRDHCKKRMNTIGILLFDGVEELDAVGPWEVFGVAAKEQPDIRTITIAPTMDVVTCAKGLRLLPDHAIETAPKLDIILVAGGEGVDRGLENRVLLDWIARVSRDCTWVTSVCTGSLLLAAAGPARGKRATTHWAALDRLRQQGFVREVVAQTRYVRDGNVVTAAGVSAGIDMALWLLGQMYSPELARRVQRRMEYDPAPPYGRGDS